MLNLGHLVALSAFSAPIRIQQELHFHAELLWVDLMKNDKVSLAFRKRTLGKSVSGDIVST